MAAVRIAVMVEDIAAKVWAELQIETPETGPTHVVKQIHKRNITAYGQRSTS